MIGVKKSLENFNINNVCGETEFVPQRKIWTIYIFYMSAGKPSFAVHFS